MNKKYVKTGVGLLIGGVLIASSAFMSLANGQTGYESLKEILKNSKNPENATIKVKADLLDNGKNEMGLTAVMKINDKKDEHSGKVDFSLNGKENSFKVYSNGENNYLDKDGQVYEIVGGDIGKNCEYKSDDDKEFSKIHEKFLDTIVGDYKKLVEEEDLKKGKKISISLKENQIPEIINSMLSLKSEKGQSKAVEMKESCEFMDLFGIDFEDIKSNDLESDIKIKSVDFSLIADNKDTLQEVNFSVTVIGKDENGVKHTKELNTNIKFSDLNRTTVDEMKIDEKNVKTIECDKK